MRLELVSGVAKVKTECQTHKTYSFGIRAAIVIVLHDQSIQRLPDSRGLRWAVTRHDTRYGPLAAKAVLHAQEVVQMG